MVGSLETALRYRGCPICHLLDEDEYDFMCQIQGQTIKEEKILRDLVESNGYCNFHFYEMARLTSPRVNAAVARALIEKEIQEIEDGFSPGPESIDCPVCNFIRNREEGYLREFMDFLRDESIQEEYASSDGLCRLHLKAVLHLAGDNQLGQFLLFTQVRQLKRLRLELQELIAPSGSPVTPKGRRGNSWWVAIKKRVGKKGLKEYDPSRGGNPSLIWERRTDGH